jgi:hypothetical protein
LRRNRRSRDDQPEKRTGPSGALPCLAFAEVLLILPATRFMAAHFLRHVQPAARFN